MSEKCPAENMDSSYAWPEGPREVQQVSVCEGNNNNFKGNCNSGRIYGTSLVSYVLSCREQCELSLLLCPGSCYKAVMGKRSIICKIGEA